MTDRGGSAAQMVEAKRKFAERIAVLERQKIDIEDSLEELRRSIVSIDARAGDPGHRRRLDRTLRPVRDVQGLRRRAGRRALRRLPIWQQQASALSGGGRGPGRGR